MIQQTSLEAYSSIKFCLNDMQKTVYNAILCHPNMSNKEISIFLNWDINRVTPRVFELREAGLVFSSGDKVDSVTNRRVLCWSVFP